MSYTVTWVITNPPTVYQLATKTRQEAEYKKTVSMTDLMCGTFENKEFQDVYEQMENTNHVVISVDRLSDIVSPGRLYPR